MYFNGFDDDVIDDDDIDDDDIDDDDIDDDDDENNLAFFAVALTHPMLRPTGQLTATFGFHTGQHSGWLPN